MPPQNWQSAPSPESNPTPPAPAQPQPQLPPQPYQTPPRGPSPAQPWQPPQPELASHYIKPRKRWLLPALISLLAIAVAATVIFLVQLHRNDPKTIFNQALGNSLSTRQVKETITSDALDAAVSLNTSAPKDPRVSTLVTKTLGANTYVKGYGSLQNTYFAYASDPHSATNTPTSLLDQWIQVRSGGSLPGGVVLSPLLAASDPRYQVLGDWITGNFSSKDRGALLKLIKTSKLYTFDAKHVAETTVSGQAALVYTLSVSGDKLAVYETQAGAAYGLAPGDIAAATQGLRGTTLALKVYVQKNTRRVVRIDAAAHGLTTTTMYSGYNSAQLPAEPKANLSYSDYLKKLGS